MDVVFSPSWTVRALWLRPGGEAMVLTVVCSLFSPDVSSDHPGWLPVKLCECVCVLGSGSVCCVPVGTTLLTLWAETAYCGACRWMMLQKAWRTAGRRLEVAAEAHLHFLRRPAAGGERSHWTRVDFLFGHTGNITQDSGCCSKLQWKFMVDNLCFSWKPHLH